MAGRAEEVFFLNENLEKGLSGGKSSDMSSTAPRKAILMRELVSLRTP